VPEDVLPEPKREPAVPVMTPEPGVEPAPPMGALPLLNTPELKPELRTPLVPGLPRLPLAGLVDPELVRLPEFAPPASVTSLSSPPHPVNAQAATAHATSDLPHKIM
jgi:hypothetical protein